ncbi:MAG: RluA family pseudouridine synthase [Planctomycetales bacterium]|nr:RluA family pseudouridine synthase [Planctomycetales bacterium]
MGRPIRRGGDAGARRGPRPVRPPPPDLSKPQERIEFEVHPADDGLRLDRFLRVRMPWRSRSSLQGLIRGGRVLRRGKPARPGESVRRGDRVTILVPQPPGPPPDPGAIPLRILWEDDALVAVDKQAGLVVHPVAKHRLDTLVNALHRRYRRLDDPAADRVPRLVHRLDRDTSGVMVVTLRPEVRATLAAQFWKRTVKKEYYALVDGAVPADEFEIPLPIGPDPDARVTLKRRAGEGGPLRSSTRVRVIERFPGATAVVAEPLTGRTHQIRVHLAAIGHPILCDALYGDGAPVLDREGRPVLARQALHAWRLQFAHPLTGAAVALEAPIPGDLLRAAEVLRRR